MTKRYLLLISAFLFLGNLTRAIAHNNIPEQLNDYHSIQAALSTDDFQPAQDAAKELNLEVQDWLGDHDQTDPLRPYIQSVQDGVTALLAAVVTDDVAIRAAFTTISDALIQVVNADGSLRTQWTLYYCPMAKKYWIQPTAETKILNPYLGSQMQHCGNKTPWSGANDINNATASHLALHHLDHLVVLKKVDPTFLSMFKSMTVTVLPRTAATDPAFKVTTEQYPAADQTKSTLETVLDGTGKALTDKTHMATGPALGAPIWTDKDAITLSEDAQHFLLDPAQVAKPEMQPFLVALSSYDITQVGSGTAATAQVDFHSEAANTVFRVILKPDGTVVSGNIVP